jgi:hypothetical protein
VAFLVASIGVTGLGCSDEDDEAAIPVSGAVVALGDAELEVTFGCHEDVRVEVDEDPARVKVRGFGRGPIDADCASTGAAVLDEPLGDRQLEDGHTGRILSVIPADPDVEVWDGQVTVDLESGEVAAPGLNALIDATAPSWARDPADAALLALGDSIREGTRSVATTTDGERHVVTVLFEDLPDDSATASRYVLVFDLADDGFVRFVSGSYGQRCQPGRGHQDFTPDPCT